MHSRLQKSIEEMAEFCPNLVYEAVPPAGDGGIWRGRIQPVVSHGHLEEILDDIHHHRLVYGAPRGELRHHDSCAGPHCRHDWMDQITDLRIPFEIEISHDGSREQPKCWVVSPHIPPEKRRHMWADGSICPFLASDDAWVWNRDTVADFVPYVSSWLVTWAVFDQTGVWIAGEHQSTPEYHLEVIKASHQCWCRSGRKYRKCHMRADQTEAATRRLRGQVLGRKG